MSAARLDSPPLMAVGPNLLVTYSAVVISTMNIESKTQWCTKECGLKFELSVADGLVIERRASSSNH